MSQFKKLYHLIYLKKFFCILILLSGSWSYGNDALENYFSSLFQMEYQEAAKNAFLLRDDLVGPAQQLAQTLYYAENQPASNDQGTKEVSSVNEALVNLALGYQKIYSNPNTAQSFEFFNSVYLYSKENSILYLQKFALISILEVFNVQVEQSNEQYLEYLDTYQNLISDDLDRYYLKMHQLNYNLKHVSLSLPLKNEFFSDFDKLISRLADFPNLEPNYLSSKAVYFEFEGDLDYADELYDRAINLSRSKPFLRFIVFRSFIHKAEIARREERYSTALKFIDSSTYYKNSKDTTRANYYINYYSSKNYNLLGENDKAYQTLQKAVRLKSLLDYEENMQQISRLNVKYQTKEKERKNQELQQEKRTLLIVLILSVLIISTIGFLVYKNSQKKRKLAEQQKNLERQKVANLLKDQELASIDAMIEGQEKERTRIAGELHDDLGALMTNVRMHFEALKNAPSEDLYQKTNTLLDEAYAKVRTIAHAKNSGVIANQGLLKALKDLAHKISQLNGLQIDVQAHGMDTRLENSLELSLFRIIQELITNVIKHAQAKTLTIHLVNHGDSLNIMVEDDGVGFDPRHISKRSEGMGINAIDKRVAHLNGTLEIESEPGQGTSVIIDLPL
ncbi:hypothetical protein CJ305_02105 [Leeuwenhoekiella nanhaiensis]|uniref:Oxygen sensor histidine kinase NreB n=2 Tax=Leeuwenhoekiella nanhaiensis TaxID=1655491 RepID=A0A2G1VWD4_9FLAO|nr:hypothetical protein CJ305_02105 [Leeuwenhoekiella nanhaiensis]